MSQIIKTDDGSHTLYNLQFNETYHSVKGAIQESKHIFIKAAYNLVNKTQLSILEVGFGTGLNCLLTYIESLKSKTRIIYTTIELFPVSEENIKLINYPDLLSHAGFFNAIHQCNWNTLHEIRPGFRFIKHLHDIQSIELNNSYDLVYFDAFSPKVQPELWTDNVFSKIHLSMNTGGILTTYSAKGEVRRTLQNCGFIVERIPGPPGKREMLRAIKS